MVIRRLVGAVVEARQLLLLMSGSISESVRILMEVSEDQRSAMASSRSVLAKKKIVLEFIKDFESFWNVKADQINLSALWAQAPPKEANGQGMHEYLEKVGQDTFLYANYHSAADFRDRYFKNYGKKPFVSKFV
ncbi:MAG: hypothetical protein LQ351_001673 [Letrouitia transgressa]|nr:MAG: hypothetical protein LQ351_001673 [Letrouitia transgressa]